MNKGIKGVSIIVCCYNSAKRLPETLKHLALQQVSKKVGWEVILVNNNSKDDTSSVAKDIWQRLGEPTKLRVIDEPRPGLSYAREKGAQESNFEILIWCDDDNWFCNTYVQTAFDIMENDPNIGALGGWCEAAFEEEKPLWFDQYERYFAVAKQGKRSGDITNKKGCLFGAGMVLRKSHGLKLKKLGFKNLLSDRKGNSLSSGGDTEYCYALRLLGYKMWYDERLHFKHFMQKGRATFDYVSEVRKTISYSNFVLKVYLDELNDAIVTQKTFSKKFVSMLFRKRTVKLIFHWFMGTFGQREEAKEYFRNLYYLGFAYNEYMENRQSILEWLPK